MNLKSKLLGTNPNESTPLSRAIFFVIIGIAFYLLDRFSLFIVDDFQYTYNIATGGKINTIKDIIESQSAHYVQHNGRFLVHCVVQLFCGILGVEWFRIFNTMMFVLFCAMTARITCGTYRISIMLYALVAFAIWLFIPRIGYTMLGNIAFSVNYLWVGVATLAFIILWQKISQKEKECSAITNIGLGVVGAIIGSLQESFSIPVAGTLFIYYCFNFKKFRGSIVWLVCGYWLGALALIVAPGNFVRLQTVIEKESLIIALARRSYTILQDFLLLIVFVVFHIVMLLIRRFKIRQFIANKALFYIMLVIGLIFAVVVAYKGAHQLFFLGWLVILLLLQFLYEQRNLLDHNLYPIVIGFIFFCMLPMYGYAYKYRVRDYVNRVQFIQAVRNSEQGNVVVGNWYANEINKSNFADRYATSSPFEPWKHLVSLYYTGDTAHLMNYVPCVMSELLDFIEMHTPISPNVWYLDKYYCYVVKAPISVPIETIKIEVERPDNFISRIKRNFTNEPPTYIFSGDQIMDIVQEGDFRYLMVWEFYYNPVINVLINS